MDRFLDDANIKRKNIINKAQELKQRAQQMQQQFQQNAVLQQEQVQQNNALQEIIQARLEQDIETINQQDQSALNDIPIQNDMPIQQNVQQQEVIPQQASFNQGERSQQPDTISLLSAKESIQQSVQKEPTANIQEFETAEQAQQIQQEKQQLFTEQIQEFSTNRQDLKVTRKGNTRQAIVETQKMRALNKEAYRDKKVNNHDILLEKQNKAAYDLLDAKTELEILSRMIASLDSKKRPAYETRLASVQDKIKEQELRLSIINNLLK